MKVAPSHHSGDRKERGSSGITIEEGDTNKKGFTFMSESPR
jgi:hypothetical protein